MSSRTYRGRHAAGRRSGLQSRRARSGSTRRGLTLPVVASAALVVTATGASVAESEPTVWTPVGREAATAQHEVRAEASTEADLADRRQSAALSVSAVRGRAESQERAARAAKREAAARAAAAAKAEREGKRWVRPIGSWQITSAFGPRWGRQHHGLDVGASTGTPLMAMSRGTVVKARWDGSFGNKVEIRYWNGQVSWYAHLSRIDVREGQTVMPGDVVGQVGSTGRSTGPHMHIEIHPTVGVDSPIAPLPWLQQRGLI